MKFWAALAMVSCVSWTAQAALDDAVENRPCLDYWAVGNSKGCAPAPKKKPNPPPVATPSPTVVAPVAVNTPPSDTLESKIDKYLEDHGKPPREFVAFYLDPTPEHAVQWVAKYNEILQRNQDIALAWTQAETLYNDAVKAGTPATALNPNPYPVVPDFGIPVPGFNTPAYTQLMGNGKGPSVVKADLASSFMPTNPYGDVLLPPDHVGGLLKPISQEPITLKKPLSVNYYFSAACPYCKKFEPGFAEAVKSLGESVRLTCVDVTPEIGEHKQSPENVGNLPCTWRVPQDAELAQVGVKQTPSLVIDRGDASPLELIAGYVEPSQVREYLFSMMKSMEK